MQSIVRQTYALGLLAVLTIPAGADEPMRTITVTGTGEVTAPPDMATIRTGVVTQAATAKDALKDNNAAMETIMQVLKEHDVAAKDVQTSSFNVSPIYKRDDRGRQIPEIDGYRVQNQVRVQVRDLARLGEVLDALVAAGSNQISGIGFDVDEKTGLLNQARSRAIRDAQNRAEVYAQAAGVKVGEVRQISEQPDSIPRPLQMGYARTEAAAVPIATGEQVFQVTVHVVYELEDAD